MSRILYSLVLLISVRSYSQNLKYDYKWLLPDYTRNIMVMDFLKPVDSAAIRIDKVKKFIWFVTGSIISNKDGNLLAYSNGCQIHNKEFDVMENGLDLNPGNDRMLTCPDYYASGEQGAVFIPDPSNPDRYYIIHCSNVYRNSPLYFWVDAIRYSIIDMSYNNGLGKVIKKNEVVLNDSSTLSDISVVRHINNVDSWIIIKKYFVAKYDIFLLNSNGISRTTTQVIGDTTNFYLNGGGVDQKFSPDGSMMVRYHPYDDGFYLYDFDRTKGELSNFRRIPVIDSLRKDGGACFSPSGRFIYISTYWDLYQYDLEAIDIKGSEVHIAHYDGYKSVGLFAAMIGKMQLGPDCKIYVNCRNSMDALHVIHMPDEKGLACDYRPHSLKLPQTHLGMLPYFPNYRLGYAPVCDPNLNVSVSLIPIEEEIRFYPNPASTYTKLSIERPVDGSSRLNLINSEGKVIHQCQLRDGVQYIKIDVSEFPRGIYFCNWSDNTGIIATGKLVVD